MGWNVIRTLRWGMGKGEARTGLPLQDKRLERGRSDSGGEVSAPGISSW